MKEFFSNNFKLIIILGVIILVLGIGFTIAAASEGISLNWVTINTGKYGVVYNGTLTVPSSKLTPIYDSELTNSSNSSKIMKITFSVKGASTNPTLYTTDTTDPIYGTEKNDINIIYDVSLTNLDIPVNLKSEHFKWKLLKNGSEISSGNFSDVFDAKIGHRMVLTEVQQDLPNYSETADSYVFYAWLSEPCSSSDITQCGTDTDTTPFLDSTFSGEIRIELSTETKKILSRPEGSPASATLTSLGLRKNYKGFIKDFSTTSEADGTSGIYAENDDFGTSYYFRGDVDYNYVKFGKNTSDLDMYWRIVRINGDGTIRMIYDGTSPHPNGKISTDRQIGASAFNTAINDNTYVGYMYGTAGASSYSTTHSNKTDSTIKAVVDAWYSSTFDNTEYEEYIADAIYCNDRTLDTTYSSYTGIGTTTTYYASYLRLLRYADSKNPTLKCINSADRFTITNSKLEFGDGEETNKKLIYPIGLITADEISFAGGRNVATNTSFYLHTGWAFWTMTPIRYVESAARNVILNDDGSIDNHINSYSYGIRPVISLKADAIIGGIGSMDEPFYVL